MDSINSLRLAGLAVICAVHGTACSQFPSLVRMDPAARPTVSRDSRSVAVMQFGEDPNAFESAIDPRRRRSNLLIARARLAIADGDTAAARQLLEGVLDAEPDHGDASHLMAVLLAQSGDAEAAETHFRTALSGEESNPKLDCDYGYFCYLSGRWDEAERYLTRAAESDPAIAEARTNLGMLAARRGNLNAAAEYFHNAGCTEVEVLNNLALARFLEEDFAAAQSSYRDALKLDPGNRTAEEGLRMVNHMASSGERVDSPDSQASGTARVDDLETDNLAVAAQSAAFEPAPDGELLPARSELQERLLPRTSLSPEAD